VLLLFADWSLRSLLGWVAGATEPARWGGQGPDRGAQGAIEKLRRALSLVARGLRRAKQRAGGRGVVAGGLIKIERVSWSEVE
jgi:hypothetical protein